MHIYAYIYAYISLPSFLEKIEQRNNFPIRPISRITYFFRFLSIGYLTLFSEAMVHLFLQSILQTVNHRI